MRLKFKNSDFLRDCQKYKNHIVVLSRIYSNVCPWAKLGAAILEISSRVSGLRSTTPALAFNDTEFCCDKGFASPVSHCPADQLFIVSVATGVGCIDERTPHVKRVARMTSTASPSS